MHTHDVFKYLFCDRRFIILARTREVDFLFCSPAPAPPMHTTLPTARTASAAQYSQRSRVLPTFLPVVRAVRGRWDVRREDANLESSQPNQDLPGVPGS